MKGLFPFSQVTLEYFSSEDLSIIQKALIGIAGVGGVGSNCAVMLVRSGFSRFVIADPDIVSPSNLNRQVYWADHIGRPKVECLCEICASINPAVNIMPIAAHIQRENIHTIFDQCDVILEAFDDPAFKALLFEEYLQSEKLLVGVSGIGGIGRTDLIVIRKIRENCYIVGDGVSEVSETVKPHAPRVMVAAAKMADIVLAHTLGHPLTTI